MLASLLVAALGALSVALPGVEPGTALVYRGTLIAQKGDPVDSKKSFEVAWVIGRSDDAGAGLFWTLTEQGRGAWAWPDRVGRWELDGKGQGAGTGPALLYERSDGKSVIGLAAPVLSADGGPLQKDQAWQHERLDYQVVARQTLGERPVWRVEARNALGVRRTYWVDVDRPIVRSYRERVFIGQGLEFEMVVELADERRLDEGAATAAVGGFEKLLKLRDDLVYPGRAARIEWNDKQLDTLKAFVAELPAIKQVELLGPVAQAVDQDVKNQKGRAGAVASLREKAVGRAAGQWKLDAMRGAAFDSASLQGKVTVLHFWEYRDTPLEEPYGQVGFLDFLSRKRQAAGVQVLGVAVADAAAGDDPEAKKRALQSASRLKNFMNLSYSILVDDGSVLKQFGDPRTAGGKLPLFVVIGKDGKIAEFHAGLYEVQRDRGLEQLDKLVTQALESPE